MANTEGYIYILTNPSFPPYVKIGYANNVEARVKKLNQTECTPFGFRIYAKYKVNSRLKDKCLHALIDILNPTLRSVDDIDGNIRKREFYSISPEQAYSLLKNIAAINGLEDNLILVAKTTEDTQDEENANKIEVKHDRAKPFTFEKAKIPAGAEITYILDESIKAYVCEDLKHVTYKGEVYSLSSLVSNIIQYKIPFYLTFYVSIFKLFMKKKGTNKISGTDFDINRLINIFEDGETSEEYSKLLDYGIPITTVTKISNSKISVENLKNQNYDSTIFDEYEKIIIGETISLL